MLVKVPKIFLVCGLGSGRAFLEPDLSNVLFYFPLLSQNTWLWVTCEEKKFIYPTVLETETSCSVFGEGPLGWSLHGIWYCGTWKRERLHGDSGSQRAGWGQSCTSITRTNWLPVKTTYIIPSEGSTPTDLPLGPPSKSFHVLKLPQWRPSFWNMNPWRKKTSSKS